MTLAEARDHLGAEVIYRPFSLRGSSKPTPEKGIVHSVNAKYVFVRFGPSTKACLPGDLHLFERRQP